jgi:LacI family transcriptional regulator
MERFALYWTDDLRGRLGEAGYHLEVHKCHGGFSARPESALEELAKRFHPAGWVLYQSAVRVQHWFSEQALPCIITGSRHPGIRLPSVDLDYRAVCRHAGGLLLARGHRCVAFVNPASGLAGDMESEAGFLEAIHEAKGPVVEAFVVNHDGTPEGICRHLDVQLRRTPRFSALLISQPKHVLTVMGYLNRRGLRVPQDVALISRDDESFLQHVLPSVARYSASPKEMAHKLTRLVLDTLRRGAARSRDYRLMPQFIPGESLGASPVPPLASPRKAVARQGVSS